MHFFVRINVRSCMLLKRFMHSANSPNAIFCACDPMGDFGFFSFSLHFYGKTRCVAPL